MPEPQATPDLVSLSCLDDPVRRRLYEAVSASPEPLRRDEAAVAAGVGRALAVYHLDKLVGSGLLTACYRRPPGRRGPGAGRPAKYYSRSGREFTVSVPAREYELAARLLLRAVAADHSGASQAALCGAARQLGAERARRASGAAAGGARLMAVLAEHGYEPARHGGAVRLRNCPFHQLVAEDRETVCHMSLALIEGLAAGLGAGTVRPVLDPQPGYCCVAVDADLP